MSARPEPALLIDLLNPVAASDQSIWDTEGGWNGPSKRCKRKERRPTRPVGRIMRQKGPVRKIRRKRERAWGRHLASRMNSFDRERTLFSHLNSSIAAMASWMLSAALAEAASSSILSVP